LSGKTVRSWKTISKMIVCTLCERSMKKKQLLQRLNRIEGQVGGLRKMIENDCYSGDEVQQASAITPPCGRSR